jgi:hypothetical protein
VGANSADSRSVSDTQNPAKWVAGERDKIPQAFCKTVVFVVLLLPLVRNIAGLSVKVQIQVPIPGPGIQILNLRCFMAYI